MAEIVLLKEAIKSECDYYHLISGMDLPLHDMNYIDDFFIKHKGKEFIHFSELGETMSSRTRQRISIYHPFQNMLGRRCMWAERILNRVESALGINRLRRFPSLVLGKGAQWFSITDNFARYIVNNWSWCKQIFAYSFCSDEMFLQTMILNSSYRENIYHPQADDDYRAIMRLIQWHQGDSTTFHTKDYQELIYSPMLFAWKFNENIDEETINLIAEHIRG